MSDRHSSLPLTPLTTSILLALSAEDQHGYALMQEVERQTRGALRPGTGSLYAALQRLVDEGLIVESANRPARGEDRRRKYFRITAAGRWLARREMARMARVLEVAREKALISDVAALGEVR